MTNLPDWAIALVTRGAGIVVGYLVAFLADHYGVSIDGNTQTHLTLSLVAIFTTVYAVVHSAAEHTVKVKKAAAAGN